MKNKIQFIIIITTAVSLLLLSNACQPVTAFDKPMPPDIESITSIPEPFIGVYLCESDSNLIYIDQHEIYKESLREFYTTRDKVKETENCALVAGGLFLPGRAACIPVEFIGEDSIYAKIYEVDLLFGFRENEIAKYHNGHLFLNLKDKKDYWYTFLFTPNNDGSVEWKLVDVPNVIDSIENITHNYTSIEIEKNRRQFVLSPTLVEFEDILEKEYFLNCEYLTPINSEQFIREIPMLKLAEEF